MDHKNRVMDLVLNGTLSADEGKELLKGRCADCGTGDPRDHSMSCNAPCPAVGS